MLNFVTLLQNALRTDV